MKKLLALMLAAAMVFAACSDGFAKGGRSGGGGGGRSSSSSSSRSSGSSWGSRSSSSSNSRPSSATNSTPSYSQKAKAASQSSPNTKSFASKSQAEQAFKKDNASKYSSKFDKEPAKRPDYIPQTTTVGNQNVNISYNGTYGGYGYMHPTLGTWMMYDMMSDAVMMSAMMNRTGYVVGSPVATGPPVVVASAWSFWQIFFSIIFISVVCVGVIYIVSQL